MFCFAPRKGQNIGFYLNDSVPNNNRIVTLGTVLVEHKLVFVQNECFNNFLLANVGNCKLKSHNSSLDQAFNNHSSL